MGFFKKDISEQEDDAFCKKMLDDYLKDPDPNKYGGTGLEDLALKLGIDLNGI